MAATRRAFLAASVSVGLGCFRARAEKPRRPKLRKAIKYGMIAGSGSPTEKLRLARKVGFEGVEIDRPGPEPIADFVTARDETGVIIHGVIDSVHWKDTLSHPDEAIRARGLAALQSALADAKAVGADTVLLVPGVVNADVTFQQCWDRSTAEVYKALPDAEKYGVKIAIEVVWNNFLSTPEQLVEYVDQFHSPWVGAYFDVSNMIKYGVPPATWIRVLGKRMLKFDFKGYSSVKAREAGNERAGFGVKIGEGSEDWPEVLRALADIGYDGWATAEVAAGGEDWLADVSARMDRVLGLK